MRKCRCWILCIGCAALLPAVLLFGVRSPSASADAARGSSVVSPLGLHYPALVSPFRIGGVHHYAIPGILPRFWNKKKPLSGVLNLYIKALIDTDSSTLVRGFAFFEPSTFPESWRAHGQGTSPALPFEAFTGLRLSLRNPSLNVSRPIDLVYAPCPAGADGNGRCRPATTAPTSPDVQVSVPRFDARLGPCGLLTRRADAAWSATRAATETAAARAVEAQASASAPAAVGDGAEVAKAAAAAAGAAREASAAAAHAEELQQQAAGACDWEVVVEGWRRHAEIRWALERAQPRVVDAADAALSGALAADAKSDGAQRRLAETDRGARRGSGGGKLAETDRRPRRGLEEEGELGDEATGLEDDGTFGETTFGMQYNSEDVSDAKRSFKTKDSATLGASATLTSLASLLSFPRRSQDSRASTEGPGASAIGSDASMSAFVTASAGTDSGEATGATAGTDSGEATGATAGTDSGEATGATAGTDSSASDAASTPVSGTPPPPAVPGATPGPSPGAASSSVRPLTPNTTSVPRLVHVTRPLPRHVARSPSLPALLRRVSEYDGAAGMDSLWVYARDPTAAALGRLSRRARAVSAALEGLRGVSGVAAWRDVASQVATRVRGGGLRGERSTTSAAAVAVASPASGTPAGDSRTLGGALVVDDTVSRLAAQALRARRVLELAAEALLAAQSGGPSVGEATGDGDAAFGSDATLFASPALAVSLGLTNVPQDPLSAAIAAGNRVADGSAAARVSGTFGRRLAQATDSAPPRSLAAASPSAISPTSPKVDSAPAASLRVVRWPHAVPEAWDAFDAALAHSHAALALWGVRSLAFAADLDELLAPPRRGVSLRAALRGSFSGNGLAALDDHGSARASGPSCAAAIQGGCAVLRGFDAYDTSSVASKRGVLPRAGVAADFPSPETRTQGALAIPTTLGDAQSVAAANAEAAREAASVGEDARQSARRGQTTAAGHVADSAQAAAAGHVADSVQTAAAIHATVEDPANATQTAATKSVLDAQTSTSSSVASSQAKPAAARAAAASTSQGRSEAHTSGGSVGGTLAAALTASVSAKPASPTPSGAPVSSAASVSAKVLADGATSAAVGGGSLDVSDEAVVGTRSETPAAVQTDMDGMGAQNVAAARDDNDTAQNTATTSASTTNSRAFADLTAKSEPSPPSSTPTASALSSSTSSSSLLLRGSSSHHRSKSSASSSSSSSSADVPGVTSSSADLARGTRGASSRAHASTGPLGRRLLGSGEQEAPSSAAALAGRSLAQSDHSSSSSAPPATSTYDLLLTSAWAFSRFDAIDPTPHWHQVLFDPDATLGHSHHSAARCARRTKAPHGTAVSEATGAFVAQRSAQHGPLVGAAAGGGGFWVDAADLATLEAGLNTTEPIRSPCQPTDSCKMLPASCLRFVRLTNLFAHRSPSQNAVSDASWQWVLE